jgi:hypothetical protein
MDNFVLLLFCPDQGGWHTGVRFEGRWFANIATQIVLRSTHWLAAPPDPPGFDQEASHITPTRREQWRSNPRRSYDADGNEIRPMDLGNMREHGVRSVAASLLSGGRLRSFRLGPSLSLKPTRCSSRTVRLRCSKAKL